MRRFGIVSRSQIPEGLSVGMDEPPAIAFSMLPEFTEPLGDRDEVAIEMICNAMATGHGLVHRRRTFAHRYDPINAAIVEAARAGFRDDRPLRVYDVAVSNGISALEFFQALEKNFEIDFRGMDYLDSITVVGPFRQWSVVFDNVGRPLQFVGERQVIPIAAREPWRYPLNRLLRAWLQLALLGRAKAVLAQHAGTDPRIRVIDAFHPRARALANVDARFRLGHGDMYEPVEHRFDIIRAMSVFSNLDSRQVTRAVRALCTSLVEGGFFVAGRNPGRHSQDIPTTIFRRQANRLTPLVELMGGAEQSRTIMAVDLGPSS